MHIRPANLQDVPQLVKLGRQLLELHITYDYEYYRLEDNFDETFGNWIKDQLNQLNQFIFVAIDENTPLTTQENIPVDRIIGFISGFIKSLYPWFCTKTVGHLAYLIINPDYRQKGISRLLEEESIRWFKSKNVSYVEVYVEEKNSVGQIVWDNFGYLPFKKFLKKKI